MIKCRKWGWLGCGGIVGGKWRQLYLNNNKKFKNSSNITQNNVFKHLPHLISYNFTLDNAVHFNGRNTQYTANRWCCSKHRL